MRKVILLLPILIFIFAFSSYSQTLPKGYTVDNSSGTSYIIGIPTEANPMIGTTALKDGDVIGVFTSDKSSAVCGGAVIWHKTAVALVAWRDNDFTTNKVEGFAPGGDMFWRIYSGGVSYYATATYSDGSSKFRTELTAMPAILKTLKGTVKVGIEDQSNLPSSYALQQNYPNPFNPTTNIGFTIPFASKVSIVVYDITGKEIVTILNNENRSSGAYNVIWNGLNSQGKRVSSGVYFYKMSATGTDNNSPNVFTQVKSMILSK